MLSVVMVVGFLILIIGLAVLVVPSVLKKTLKIFLEKKWLPAASIIRIVIGVLFLFAAPETKAPQFIFVLGIIFIFAGIIIPFIGAKRIERFGEWWLKSSDLILRLWAVLVIIFGILIIRAVL